MSKSMVKRDHPPPPCFCRQGVRPLANIDYLCSLETRADGKTTSFQVAVAGRKSLRKPGERSAEGPDGAVENLTAGGEALTAPGSGNGAKGPESEQVAWGNQTRWRGSGSDGTVENLTAGGEVLTALGSGNGRKVPEVGAFQGGGVREKRKKGVLKPCKCDKANRDEACC